MEEIIASLSGTISPWIFGTFFTLSLAALFAAVKNWREMKRSPYFFQRLQAGKRLQTYLSSSAFLFLITIFITSYAWQVPQDDPILMAILVNSKPTPVAQEENSDLSNIVEVIEDASPSSFQLEDTEHPGQLLSVADQPFVAAKPELPAEYDRFEPTAELSKNSNLGEVSFSTDVTEDYQAVDAREIFAEGFYTLYATFSYDGLADGMAWSWIWRHDGELVEGGNEIWTYGDEGPGYIYFAPEEGFDAGHYSLEIWVNDELMAQSAVIMNNASISANN
ncbi:MAG: hypothetical protein R3293_10190 [Candidatus Promineifilaceae bacterium]|nr:hypothetical protein [Candidatus Promineifilaceae bacterium]